MHDSLVPLPSETIVEKTKPSAFDGTNFASLLQAAEGATKGSVEFVVTGMQSDCCVVATAQDLLKLYPDARTVIVKGAHWTFDYGTKSAKDTAAAVNDLLEKKGAAIVDIRDLKF